MWNNILHNRGRDGVTSVSHQVFHHFNNFNRRDLRIRTYNVFMTLCNFEFCLQQFMYIFNLILVDLKI